MSGPEAITVVRHRCPHCHKSWAKRTDAISHMTWCFKDPEHRACQTCKHFEPAHKGSQSQNPIGMYYDDSEPQWCFREVDISEHRVSSCPEWEASSPTLSPQNGRGV